MEPSLRIATVILESVHLWPFWDALLLAPIVQVPSHELPAGEQNKVCYKFSPRLAHEVGSDEGRKKVQKVLLDRAGAFQFGILSGYNDDATGLPTNTQLHGLTFHAPDAKLGSNIRCNVDLYMIEPLLDPQLQPGERTLCQYELASTILHELAVSRRSSTSIVSKTKI